MKAIVLTLALSLVVVPAATAKGPSGADIQGPGTGGGISIGGSGEGPSSPLDGLTTHGGFFPATFGQQPDPMRRARPEGDLGPKYTVTFTVPGPNGESARIRMDAYPYAGPNPVTYTPPGQPFFSGERTHGGWYVAPAALRSTLVAAGLPASPPSSAADGSVMAGVTAGAISVAVMLAIAGLAFVALRRRPRGAPA